MRVIYHNWSATKQRTHPQTVAEISRHSVLSGNRIRQCETSSGSRHKDTDQCLIVAISFCRHRSVPVPCENGSAETTVAEGSRNPVAGLWGCTPGENWSPEPTSSYASIDFWCQLVANLSNALIVTAINTVLLASVQQGLFLWTPQVGLGCRGLQRHLQWWPKHCFQRCIHDLRLRNVGQRTCRLDCYQLFTLCSVYTDLCQVSKFDCCFSVQF